ncbi:hypothetical protein C8R45DRAFT_1000732 [Mycena sanguinolenta]|nr:hypothetical protein C8R45DRAFT_1000732 [Mycena sanguinolenta]
MSQSVSVGHVLLDDDIVDRIMTFCPTFDTLRSTVLVSKAFYRIFQAHPKSITRAVSYNIVGPALPQALRVIRYPYHEYTLDSDPLAVAAAYPEEPRPVVIPREEQVLLENSQVVAVLEDVYSRTNKDNKSRTSVLSSEESWRFRRAVYRVMLYSNLFPHGRYENDEILDMDDECVDKIRKQRTAVLNEYPTDELRELWSVVKFFVDIFDRVDVNDPNMISGLLSTGPSGVLQAWQTRSYHMLHAELVFLYEVGDNPILFQGYLSIPLQNIWIARSVPPPKPDDPASKWILDQIPSANDTCSQCAASGGLALYTEANWDWLPVNLMQSLLRNHLKANPVVLNHLHGSTPHLSDFEAPERFVGDLFALKPRTAPEFDNWERTDSYCWPCLNKFLEAHVWIWLLDETVKAGWTPPEDCWYGWNCRTQTHKRYHAETKNHLCVPIKGDPA